MPKIFDNTTEKELYSLQYPDDLGVGFTHPDCVKFTIGTNPGVSLEGVKKVVAGKIESSKVALGKSFIKGIAELEADKAALGKKPAKEKEEALTAKLNTLKKGFESFQNRIATGATNFEDLGGLLDGVIDTGKEAIAALRAGQTKNVFTSISSIYLPMPENLVYNEPIDWQGTDLGMMKGAADALLGKGGSDNALGGAALSQTGNMLAGGAGAIVSKLLGGGLLGGAVLGSLGGGDGVQGAIESNLRIRSNPFKEQTFQGVGFRPFEFSFVFNARSQSEVNMIRKIVNSFRKYSKPSLDKPDSAIFSYPAEFEIEFLTKDEYDNFNQNTYLPRLKRCVCKSVNTNFTTAGWKSFNDGAPTTITLQLGFEETDIITSEQIDRAGEFGEKGGF